jgi:hypothetical protein
VQLDQERQVSLGLQAQQEMLELVVRLDRLARQARRVRLAIRARAGQPGLQDSLAQLVRLEHKVQQRLDRRVRLARPQPPRTPSVPG